MKDILLVLDSIKTSQALRDYNHTKGLCYDLIKVYNKFIIDILEKAYLAKIRLETCPPVSQDVIYGDDKFIGYVGDYITELYYENHKFYELVSFNHIHLFSAISKFKVIFETRDWLIANNHDEKIDHKVKELEWAMIDEYNLFMFQEISKKYTNFILDIRYPVVKYGIFSSDSLFGNESDDVLLEYVSDFIETNF